MLFKYKMNVQLVDCIGDPRLESTNIDDGPLRGKSFDDKKHYKLEDLPGGIAIFIIRISDIAIRIKYDTSEITFVDLIDFIESVEDDYNCRLGTSNIKYRNGYIEFKFDGCAGNESVNFSIRIEASKAIRAFKRLI